MAFVFSCNIVAFSTTLSYRLCVNGLSKGTTSNEQTPVQFLKRFKDNKYKTAFSFNIKGMASDAMWLFDVKRILNEETLSFNI